MPRSIRAFKTIKEGSGSPVTASDAFTVPSLPQCHGKLDLDNETNDRIRIVNDSAPVDVLSNALSGCRVAVDGAAKLITVTKPTCCR